MQWDPEVVNYPELRVCSVYEMWTITVLPQKLKLSYSPRVLWGASEHTLGIVAPRALNFIHSFTNSSAYKYIIQSTNRDPWWSSG